MVDLSNLKLVEEDIQITDDQSYVDAKEFPDPLPEGVYTFIQGKPTFGATNGGNLKADFEPHTVVGGEKDGQKLFFDSISNKTFQRQGVNVSIMRDHLRALFEAGDSRRASRTNAELADAIAAGEGISFKAAIKWDGFCGHKDTEHEIEQGDYANAFTVKGQRNFPAAGDLKCPTCGNVVRPRARIDRRIAK